MQYRSFGRSGVQVSALGFGAWAIGGQAYGPVDPKTSREALSRAEDLGCSLVDTAAVYGHSEAVLGEFLAGRRSRWFVATKYSGQPAGMTETLEKQLKGLRMDAVDLYQLHWVPRGRDAGLFNELEDLRASGKTRFIGVSLYTAADVDFVLAHARVDSVQVRFGLLDPLPLLARLAELRAAGVAVLVRSCLKEGFLTGKFSANSTFASGEDQRSQWSKAQIRKALLQVERCRFLDTGEADGLMRAAVRYPLSIPEVTSVLLGTKTQAQAQVNFSIEPQLDFTNRWAGSITSAQRELGLWPWRERVAAWWRGRTRLSSS